MGLFHTAPNTPYFFEKRVLTTCPTVNPYFPARIPGRAIVVQPHARSRSRARCSGFDAYVVKELPRRQLLY